MYAQAALPGPQLQPEQLIFTQKDVIAPSLARLWR